MMLYSIKKNCLNLLIVSLLAFLTACSSQPQKPGAQADHRAIRDLAQGDEVIQPSHASHPAVLALFQGAHQDVQNGQLFMAASKLERAQRIAPKDAAVYYRLAVVRLKQHQSERAEQLALKSISLAQNNKKFKAFAWELVAQARDEQGNYSGAKNARKRAAN